MEANKGFLKYATCSCCGSSKMNFDARSEQIVAMGLLRLLRGSNDIINHIDGFLYVPLLDQIGEDEDWFQIICRIPYMRFIYGIA